MNPGAPQTGRETILAPHPQAGFVGTKPDAIYSDSRAGWWPDDHPLLAALARHAHRGHPETGGLTASQEDT